MKFCPPAHSRDYARVVGGFFSYELYSSLQKRSIKNNVISQVIKKVPIDYLIYNVIHINEKILRINVNTT